MTLPHGMSELTADECRALLGRQRLCVLSVVDGSEPYAVPVFYGFDGDAIYLGVMEGRKTRALDANPAICLVVTEVGPGDEWRSVQISGTARTITNPADRERALAVLVAHNERLRDRGTSTAPRRARHTGGRVLQLIGARVSGRARI